MYLFNYTKEEPEVIVKINQIFCIQSPIIRPILNLKFGKNFPVCEGPVLVRKIILKFDRIFPVCEKWGFSTPFKN